MKNTGNIKSNEYWNPDEKKHPLPTNMEETERDSELEKFIRCKSILDISPVNASVAISPLLLNTFFRVWYTNIISSSKI